MTQHTVIDVGGSTAYPVLIGRDLWPGLPALLAGAAQVAVVHAAPLRDLADRIGGGARGTGGSALPIGGAGAEAAKTVEVAARCWDALGGANFTRSDAVIGVGGGAVTDLAG